MTKNRIGILLIISLLLLLGIASTAQAAPPRAEGGSTLGETLDLDNPDETEPVTKFNLGTIMSGRKDGDTLDEGDDEETPDDGTADGETPDDGTTDGETPDDGTTDGETPDDGTTDGETPDDGTTDGETPDDGTTDGETPDDGTTDGETPDDGTEPVKEHPVASAIAEYFEVSYDEVMSLHVAGNGFGAITRAYYFSDKTDPPMTPEELLDAAHGSGWGNVLKENGLHQGSASNGKGKRPDKAGRPENAESGQDGPPGQLKKGPTDSSSELVGQGSNNGKGKGNNDKGNNGKGKGKGKNGK